MNTITPEVWRELGAWLIIFAAFVALLFIIVSAWMHQNRKWETRRFLRRRNPDLRPFWDEPRHNKNQRNEP